MKRALPLILFALTGCATTTYPISELNQDELRDRLQQSAVSVRPVTAPVKLVERTKGQAVGNFIVASVVSSVAVSGTKPRTVNEMHANTQIGQTFGQQLNQALPTGVETEGYAVDVRLAKRLSERFQPMQEDRQGSPIELVVSAMRWELGYESFFTNSDYTLSYALVVSVVERSTEKQKNLKRISCQGQVPEKMPLDTWNADDQAALVKAADRIVEECAQKTLSSLGLET